MFKKGEKVVYIRLKDYYGDYRYGLKLHNVYTIRRVYCDCYNIEYNPIYIEGETGNWSSSQFMKLSEYRKRKLLEIDKC